MPPAGHGVQRRTHLPDEESENALIGYTGFVGGNLLRRREFASVYNSKNIEDIRGRTFDTVICAGVPAEKWRANRDPVADFASINRLWTSLRDVEAGKLILISTIDVYPVPRNVDETSSIDTGDAQPYGKHRYELESSLSDHFDCLVIRLPGLFGKGLKKNALFDLLHSNETEKIDSRGMFQFYDVGRLSGDIDTALRNGLSLLNIATEPVSIEEVSTDCFGFAFVNHVVERPASYNVRSIYTNRFGGSRGYMLSRAQVKESLRTWVAAERNSAT